jgi:hypothetical protein
MSHRQLENEWILVARKSAMIRMSRSRFAWWMAVGLIALGVGGCGGNEKLAPVSGVVTLDGMPLKSASVVFHPQAGGRPSFGVTDDSGRYRLGYSMRETGAEIGSSRVNISTALETDDGGKAKELVPKRYAKETPVVVEVKRESNTINIDLTSQ